MTSARRRWVAWVVPPMVVAAAIALHAWIDVPRGPMQPRVSKESKAKQAQQAKQAKQAKQAQQAKQAKQAQKAQKAKPATLAEQPSLKMRTTKAAPTTHAPANAAEGRHREGELAAAPVSGNR